MREFSTPLTVTVPATGNLTDDVVRNAAEAPDAVVFSRRPPGSEEWQDVTAAEFLAEVRDVAKGLVAAGVEAGDRVALISRTRYEWTLLDYAIWFAGAVSVPVYETSSAEQVGHILRDSGARAVVAEGPAHLTRIAEVRADLEELRHVWSIDDNAVRVLTRLGADIPDADLEARRTAATPLDLATIIYTSGTTGSPKGCMLTHGNFLTELGVAVPELDELFAGDDAATLLFLPLAHVFARVIQVGSVKARVRLGHSADIRNLVRDLGQFRPTFVLAVPRVFEKVFNTAAQNATADGRGRIFERATEVAIAWSRGLDSGRGRASVAVRAQHAAFSRLVYGRLRTALGSRCAYAVSGGAPLGERLGHFYRGIGLTVLEGYGLTETTGALTANTPGAVKIGTVGRPLPGTSVRVADDGELLFLGGQVFAGYWDERARHRRGARARRLVPHRRRRGDRRRGVRPDHRPQEGDPGDRRRQERRPGRPRGPAPSPRRWSASAWSSATAARSSARSSPSTRKPSRPGPPRTGRRRWWPTWSTTRTCVPRSTRPWRTPTRRSPRRSRSASTSSWPPTGPRRAASSRRASS